MPPGLALCLAWGAACCKSQNEQPEGVLGPTRGCQLLLELCPVLGQAYEGIPIAAPAHCCWHRGPELCHTAWRGPTEGGQQGIQRWAWLAGLFLGGLPVIVPLLSLPVPSTVCSARPRAAAARRCCAACPCERLSILVT